MPGRIYSAGSEYRYGFNGKELDKDMHSLTAYDYGFRIFNPAVGRFLSVDPIAYNFPWNSPYSYAEGDPINFVDLDGLEKPSMPAQAKVTPTRPPLSNSMSVNSSGNLVVRNSNMRVNSSGILQIQGRNGIWMNFIGPNNPPQGHAYISTLRNDFRGGWDQVGPNGGTTFIPDSKPYTPPTELTEEQKKEAQFEIDRITNQKRVQNSLYQEEVNPIYNIKLNLNVQANSLEVHTDDPSTLSDQYLAEVDKRIKNGSATLNDYKYQDEIARRKRDGKMSENNILSKTTYTKLSTSQIEKLKAKYGENDPDFIEKLKKPGGKGAGSVDLYANDQTGEIVVIPKAQEDKTKGGETTGYNTKKLD